MTFVDSMHAPLIDYSRKEDAAINHKKVIFVIRMK